MLSTKWSDRSAKILVATAWVSLAVVDAVGAQGAAASGFRALNGATLGEFELPRDVVLVSRFELPAYDLTYERYQQVFGPASANVLGGQLTLLKRDGVTRYVIGSHYPHIVPINTVNRTAAQARQRAADEVGDAGDRRTTLMIDPESGRHFYQVETRRDDERWFHWINAGDGTVLNRFDALMDGDGFGVQYTQDASDVKNLTGLTIWNGQTYELVTSRQVTRDRGSVSRPKVIPVATDDDDHWYLLGDKSPAQQALVDAHYYASVADGHYLLVHTFDWVDQANHYDQTITKMEVHAHYGLNINNAYWTGRHVLLGDGDQKIYRECTTLDVVGHELTHGVTDFTSNLIYQNESGALNEAFSDIMGTNMEFYADAMGLEPASTLGPDWLIGEDLDVRDPPDLEPGFRNMANPGEDGHPSHYDDRYLGTSDNGGVHINSGIANHWYYLLVNGGQNADSVRATGTDVTPIDLLAAEQIAFLGFIALPSNATFSDARMSTIAVAGSYETNVADAWDEVGVKTLASLSVSAVTDKASYVNRETVRITVTVTDATGPVSGAAVRLEITTANGKKLVNDGTTDSSGVARFTHKVDSNKNGVGAYTAAALATKAGYRSGSGSTTFVVK